MKDIILAISILLGACSTVVPSTLLQMQALDPLSADPADIALQVTLPDGVALLPEAGTLDLRAELPDGSTIGGSFPIVAVGDVLRIAPATYADLRAPQTKINGWKAIDPDSTTGSLSVAIAPCLTGGEIPADTRLSVAIRLEQDGPFLPLIQDAPVARALKGQADTAMTP